MLSHFEIRETIRPFIEETYGDSPMSRGLTRHLAERIQEHPNGQHGLGREEMIRMICWDWMTGGSTAESVAADIEDALIVAEVV